MMNKIGGSHINRTYIVTEDEHSLLERNMKLFKKLSRLAALSNCITRYSASTLEREIVVWRFDDQETSVSPRKTQILRGRMPRIRAAN
jgi:hypothetical protein